LPFIGHSYVFFKVEKQDILGKLLSMVKPDPENRKMITFIGSNNMVRQLGILFLFPVC